jgi:phage terminase small subunit
MTERQKRFVEYYLETGNARQSAVKAGYSIHYAEHVKRQKGVRDYLDKRLGAMEAGRVASADEILTFLTEVMRAEGDDDKRLATRMKAAEMLAKRLGYFDEDGTDKPEPAVIIDDIPDAHRS